MFFFLLLILLTFLLPILFVGLEVICAVIFKFKSTPNVESTPKNNDATFNILIPAHNEDAGISMTLSNLLLQVTDPYQILVVADNCTDYTAEISKEFGVQVIERFDEENRGKGYALAYGIEHLRKSIHPDVLVICDADCYITSGSIIELVEYAYANHCPAQAKYLCFPVEQSSLAMRISTFAMLFKNFIRPLGLKSLNGPSLLFGTGMAFPWLIVEKLKFANGNIVEDVQLGIDCVKVNHSPKLCETVTVESKFPIQQSAEVTQRTRWEHGHLKTLFTQAPCLLISALAQKNTQLLLLAFEIGVPPLALLVIIYCSFAIICSLTGIFLLSIDLIIIGWIPLLFLSAFILLGWITFAVKVLPLKYLLLIPWYVLRKIPVYLRFIYKPETKWIRTGRKDNERD